MHAIQVREATDRTRLTCIELFKIKVPPRASRDQIAVGTFPAWQDLELGMLLFESDRGATHSPGWPRGRDHAPTESGDYNGPA